MSNPSPLPRAESSTFWLLHINNATVTIHTNLYTYFHVDVCFPFLKKDFFNFRKTSGPIPHNPTLSCLFLRLHSGQVPPRGWGNGEEVSSLLVPRLSWWDRGSTWSDTRVLESQLPLAWLVKRWQLARRNKPRCFPFPFCQSTQLLK